MHKGLTQETSILANSPRAQVNTMFEGCLFINLPQGADRLRQFQTSCSALDKLGIRQERGAAVYDKSLPGYICL